MRQAEVVIGQTYVVLVSGRSAPVRIDRKDDVKGWHGVNIRTSRGIRIWSAAKLRRVYVPKVEEIIKEVQQCSVSVDHDGKINVTYHGS